MPDTDLVGRIEALEARLAQARASIARRFIGQERVVDLTLAALLCGGHALLVGLPGLGKTRLVDTLATVMGLKGGRIQFTPDLMPADILGSEVLDTDAAGARAFRFIEGPIFCQLLMADEINRASPRTQSALLQAMQEREVTIAGQHRPLGSPFHVLDTDAAGARAFRFIEGPIFCQLLMADEINRASPRTQSALLQAMQEREVTIAGQHRPLGVPFHVLATQNPIEQEGTYPLPEAQLDRFLVQIDVPYPTRATERDILMATTGAEEAEATAVFSGGELLQAQTLLRRMPVGEAIVEMILDLVRACRPGDAQATPEVNAQVAWGPGPRAAQALMLAVRAEALLGGRLAPSPEDVRRLAGPVLSHRMALTFAARAQGADLASLIDQTATRTTRIEAAA